MPRPHQRAALHTDTGIAATEAVGLAVALAVLLAAIIPELGRNGAGTGRLVGSRLERAVAEPDTRERSGSARTARGARSHPAARGWSHEHKRDEVWAHGSERIGADDLRLNQLAPTVGWQRWSTGASLHHRDATVQVAGRACVLCAELGERHSFALGASTGEGTGREHAGVQAQGVLEGETALAAIEGHLATRKQLGAASLSGQLRTNAVVGASGALRAQLMATHDRQRLDLGASGVAGASARVEERVAVRAAGVALQHTAGAEGWAGLGGRAELRVERDAAGRFSWHVAAGGAIGYGGAVDSSGTIDTSGLQHRHLSSRRRLFGYPAGTGVWTSLAGLAFTLGGRR